MQQSLEEAPEWAEAMMESDQQSAPRRPASPSTPRSLWQKLYDLYVEECAQQPELPGVLPGDHLLEKLVKKEALAHLVVNLHHGDGGYSMVLNDLQTPLVQTVQVPYEQAELLHYLEAEELPLALMHVLDSAHTDIFHDDCVITEIRDYRESCETPPTYQSRHILLQPTTQTLAQRYAMPAVNELQELAARPPARPPSPTDQGTLPGDSAVTGSGSGSGSGSGEAAPNPSPQSSGVAGGVDTYQESAPGELAGPGLADLPELAPGQDLLSMEDLDLSMWPALEEEIDSVLAAAADGSWDIMQLLNDPILADIIPQCETLLSGNEVWPPPLPVELEDPGIHMILEEFEVDASEACRRQQGPGPEREAHAARESLSVSGSAPHSPCSSRETLEHDVAGQAQPATSGQAVKRKGGQVSPAHGPRKRPFRVIRPPRWVDSFVLLEPPACHLPVAPVVPPDSQASPMLDPSLGRELAPAAPAATCAPASAGCLPAPTHARAPACGQGKGRDRDSTRGRTSTRRCASTHGRAPSHSRSRSHSHSRGVPGFIHIPGPVPSRPAGPLPPRAQISVQVQTSDCVPMLTPDPVPERVPVPDPMTERVPVPDPVTERAHAPDPVPERVPAPDLMTERAPAPDPVPAKAPAPDPVPSRIPAPDPMPRRAPAPGPVPERAPVFSPVPGRAPASSPVPRRAPAPGPVTERAPAPGPRPARAPVSRPVPRRALVPGPVPQRAPAPGPRPGSAPVPGPMPRRAPVTDPMSARALVPGPMPARAPAPGPMPGRAPAPGPVPSRIPATDPMPAKAPAPDPVPAKAPASGPMPRRAPTTDPVPASVPASGPVPARAPVPGPMPERARSPEPVPVRASDIVPVCIPGHVPVRATSPVNVIARTTGHVPVSTSGPVALQACAPGPVPASTPGSVAVRAPAHGSVSTSEHDRVAVRARASGPVPIRASDIVPVHIPGHVAHRASEPVQVPVCAPGPVAAHAPVPTSVPTPACALDPVPSHAPAPAQALTPITESATTPVLPASVSASAPTVLGHRVHRKPAGRLSSARVRPAAPSTASSTQRTVASQVLVTSTDASNSVSLLSLGPGMQVVVRDSLPKDLSGADIQGSDHLPSAGQLSRAQSEVQESLPQAEASIQLVLNNPGTVLQLQCGSVFVNFQQLQQQQQPQVYKLIYRPAQQPSSSQAPGAMPQGSAMGTGQQEWILESQHPLLISIEDATNHPLPQTTEDYQPDSAQETPEHSPLQQQCQQPLALAQSWYMAKQQRLSLAATAAEATDVAPPTEALPAVAPPTEAVPAAALPTEALPAVAPLTETLPAVAPPTEALPAAAPPTEALPAAAPPTKTLPAAALPSPQKQPTDQSTGNAQEGATATLKH